MRLKPDLCQLRVEKIKANRVTEFVEGEDRIVRPVSRIAAQIVDMRQVQADVPKIIPRQNPDAVIHDEDHPSELSEGKSKKDYAEENGDD